MHRLTLRVCLAFAFLAAAPWVMISSSAQGLPTLVVNGIDNRALTFSWAVPSPFSANAQVISWNVDVDSSISGAGQRAGVASAAYWNNTQQLNNNATGATVVSSNLVDNSGAVTSLCVTQNSSQNNWDYWAISFSTPAKDTDGTYNRRVLNGYQNKGSNEAPYTSSVTLSGIPYTNYDLVVYFSSDTAGRTGSVSDGINTYYFSTLGPESIDENTALFVQTTEINSANNPPADYAIFYGLTGSSQTLNVTIPAFGGIAGIQVVSIPKNQPPTANMSFVLEDTTSLTPPVAWQVSSLSIQTNNGWFSASAPLTNASHFFRLAGIDNTSSVPVGSYITNGLAAYWKLDDDGGTVAADSSGNGNQLSLIGSPLWQPGYLMLNGTSQYGSAGGQITPSVDMRDKTICAWVNKTGSSQKGIVDKSGAGGNSGWGLWAQGNNQLMWSTTANQPFYDAGGAGITPGTWTFVTLVWHYSIQRADFYIDGLADSFVGNGGAAEQPSGTADLEVGNLQNNQGGGTYAFDGSMRDVAIYNRALSAAEVETNFFSTESTTNVAIPDLLYYKMTEYAVSNPPVPIADSSTHGGTTGEVHADRVVQWETNVASLPASIHFNGTGTFIDTSNSTLFNFTTNLFTINFWAMPLTANGYLMENGYAQTNGWFLNVSGAYGIDFGANSNGTVSTVSASTGAVVEGLFTMVTIVRTGPTNILIYSNGKQVATTGTFASPASSTNSLILGTDRAGEHHLDGNIWLTQIWSTPLSSADIANLYFNQLNGYAWP